MQPPRLELLIAGVRAIKREALVGDERLALIVVEQFGTHPNDAAIDASDDVADTDARGQSEGGARASASSEPIEIAMSRDMSKLLFSDDGEVLPELGPDEHYVVQCYPSG